MASSFLLEVHCSYIAYAYCEGTMDSIDCLSVLFLKEFQDIPTAPATSVSPASYPTAADSTMPETDAVSLDSTRPPAAGPTALCQAPAKPLVSAEPRASESPTVPTIVDAESTLSHHVGCQVGPY